MKQLNLLPKKEQTKSITFYAELKLFTKFTELYKKRGITMRKKSVRMYDAIIYLGV